MKLVVLVPSTEYLGNAGARIRYERIRGELPAMGATLDFLTIDDFDAARADCDLILISKCHDARAIVGAIRARENGIRVGIDLFDDYFSQSNDSRMVRYRAWLSQLVPHLSFALCSTATMAAIASTYSADLPVHVMNDPTVPLDLGRLARVVHDKQQDFADREMLELCWFGMGRNPHFTVGISDLVAFAEMLRSSHRRGVAATLTVLTNARALDASDLAALNRLPLPVNVELWSEARESELLESAHAAFIPVNVQNFSVAKSLNRAWTALSAGCQVVSAGYPLYEALDNVIYRDIGSMVDDLRNGKARLRPENLEELAELHQQFGSASQEAAKLVEFLSSIPFGPSRTANAVIGVVHGALTSGAIHRFAQRHDALAIGSPFCPTELGFDVIFRASNPGASLMFLLGERARKLAEEGGFESLVPVGRIAERRVWSLPGSTAFEEFPANWSKIPLAVQIAAAPRVAQEMEQALTNLFGSIEIAIAENSAWPFSAVYEA